MTDKDDNDLDDEDQDEEDPLSDMRLDNLRAGRRFFNLIILVALFIVVVLLENDPARLPVLRKALVASRAYEAKQTELNDTWNDLIGIAHMQETDQVRWDNSFPDVPTASATEAWLEPSLSPPDQLATNQGLQANVFSIWHYLATLTQPIAYPGLSIDTDVGSFKVGIPTDQPTLNARTKYLQVLSSLVMEVMRDGHFTVTGIASSDSNKTEVEIVRENIPTEDSGNNRDEQIFKMLAESSTFKRLAWSLNEYKYSAAHFKDIDDNYANVRASLDDLGMWNSATEVQNNPSLIYDGTNYGRIAVHSDDCFNEPALKRVISNLADEAESMGKKMKIPLTGYEASIDTTVILSCVILVVLYICYCLTLENIRSLERQADKRTTCFFPWVIYWSITPNQVKPSLNARILRQIARVLTVIHCGLGALVIGWSIVTMLSLHTSPITQLTIVGVCLFVNVWLGVLCYRQIRKIQADFLPRKTVHHGSDKPN